MNITLVKPIQRYVLLIVSFVLVAGCAHFPTATSTVAIPVGVNDPLERVIDAARDAGLPPMTKLDKTNGIVEFGGFGNPELGTTAQVRLRGDNQLEITVKRGSVYIPFDVKKKANEFREKIEARLIGQIEQRPSQSK